jgi:hypothetical protein
LPYVVGLLSCLVDLVTCVKHEKFTNIMFSHKYDEEVPENFRDSKTTLSYYSRHMSFLTKKTVKIWLLRTVGYTRRRKRNETSVRKKSGP